MITISLDETSGFEKSTHKPGRIEPAFIAGIIYDDNDNPLDSNMETRRIAEFYEKAVKDAGNGDSSYRYPKDIHPDFNTVNPHLAPVMNKINEHLGEFLKDGTYKGNALLDQARQGRYYVYVYVKSDKDVTRKDANYLTDDNFASNRYINMATGIVGRLALHNPVIKDIKSVHFCLASRATPEFDPNNEADKKHVEEYKKEGLKNVSNSGNTLKYQIGSADIYRTALTHKMIEDKKVIVIDGFDVQSIQYRKDSDSVRIEFLYMADTICSILKKGISSNEMEDVLKEIKEGLDRINTPERNILFVYDDVDMEYEKAWKYYEQGEYYEALEIIYDSVFRNNAVSDFYDKKWYKMIREYIRQSEDLNDMEGAVKKLSDSRFSNTYNQGKGLFIYNELKAWTDSNIEKINNGNRESILVNLYKTGIPIHCHIGDSSGAEKCYELLKKYLNRLSDDDYCGALNEMAIAVSDYLNTDMALEFVDESISYLEESIKLRNRGSSLDSIDSAYMPLILGKSYSTKGMVLSNRHDPKGEEFFDKALKIMGNNVFDYKITLSYLIHYYIEMGEEKKYHDAMDYYFNEKKGVSDRLNYIYDLAKEKNPEINSKYALYVLLKGLYTFEKDKITDKVYKKITSIEKKLLKDKETILTGHPFELIYKYMALIAYEKGDEEIFEDMASKSLNCKEPGAIIQLIQAYNKILYSRMKKDKESEHKAIEAAKQLIKNNFEKVKGLVEYDDEEFFTKLSEKVNYMYS